MWIARVRPRESDAPGPVHFTSLSREAVEESLRNYLERNPSREFGGPSVRPRQLNLADAKRLGTHTAADWRAMVRAACGRCFYCGRRWERVSKDHKTPVSRGGSDALDNLAASCLACNQSKGTKTEAEYRAQLEAEGPPVQRPAVSAEKAARTIAAYRAHLQELES